MYPGRAGPVFRLDHIFRVRVSRVRSSETYRHQAVDVAKYLAENGQSDRHCRSTK